MFIGCQLTPIKPNGINLYELYDVSKTMLYDNEEFIKKLY